MKTIYATALICSCFAGFSAQAQGSATTIPNPGSAAPIIVSAAEGIPLGAMTNGVLPPTITPATVGGATLPATTAVSGWEKAKVS